MPLTRRGARLTRAAVAGVVVLAVAVGVAAMGDDEPIASGPGLAPGVTSKLLFKDHLLVQGIHGFSAAEVKRIGQAAGRQPLTVTDGEVYVRHGTGTYNEMPLATLTASANDYADAIGKGSMARQLSDGAVLSASAAALLHLKAGDNVPVIGGPAVRVTGVVEDHLLSGYQLAFGRQFDVGLGSHADYVIVAAKGSAVGPVQAAIQAALPDRRLRFTLPTRNAFFSTQGDVLAQAQVQQRFGAFTVRQTSGGFVPDPRWVSSYITQRRVVQLGMVACNRLMLPDLIAAMTEVTTRGLGKTIDTADFIREGGCWNPRTTRLGHGMLSHHAWGIAVDINVARNPLGAKPNQDARLVAIMEKHGFTWGGRWLRYDAAHFEWVGKLAA
ncbi:MAG: hypothetical protein QOG53_615 [Frankiales bacterium]|jgi:hypothetical protein|nr:hypothetical protein [Frankiales bacterium]